VPAVHLAEQDRNRLLVPAVADEMLAQAAERGFAHQDIAALFAVVEQMTTDVGEAVAAI
jgi:hypothetical protein